MKTLLTGLLLMASMVSFAGDRVYEGIWQVDGATDEDGVLQYISISKKMMLFNFGDSMPSIAQAKFTCKEVASTQKENLPLLECTASDGDSAVFTFEKIGNSSNKILMSGVEMDGDLFGNIVLIKN